MKKFEKSLIIIIIILLVVFIATIYHIIHTNNEEREKLQGINQREVIDHYTETYLTKNNYIKEANLAETSNITCTKENEGQGYAYLTKYGNIYLNVCTNSKMESKKFDTSITDIKKVYYNKLKRDLPYYEIVIIDKNNNAYYNAVAYNKETKKYIYNAISGEGLRTYKDYKIENVDTVYIQSIEKSKYYFDEETSLIFAKEDGTLKMFSSLTEGKLVNIKDRIPYFDYVCANDNPICKETTLYITFDNKVVVNFNLTETIKNEKGEELTIRDAFSSFEVEDKNYQSDIMKYSDDFNFKYTVYLISSENNLYKIELNREKIDSKEVPTATLLKKEIDIVEQKSLSNTIFENITITYKNGQKEIFKKVFNSTIIDRDYKS